MVHSFGVPDGVRSFQDSRVCISVALLPKLVMLPGRDPSLSEDDADRGAFFIFWSLVRCSQDATLIASDDEVIRMLERVLAAMFERIRRLPLILSLSLSLSLSLYIHIYICR